MTSILIFKIFLWTFVTLFVTDIDGQNYGYGHLRRPMTGGASKPHNPFAPQQPYRPVVGGHAGQHQKHPCTNLIAGKFCKDPTSYPVSHEVSKFGRSQSGRSSFFVDDPFYQPPQVKFCPESFEILAPRWALNTRGEGKYIVQNDDFVQKVLFKYCQSGYGGLGSQCYITGSCRQQYYLIQLRVFDEVYGTYSDWFEVPSGCYCASY